MNEPDAIQASARPGPAGSPGPCGGLAAAARAFLQAGRFLLPLDPRPDASGENDRPPGHWFVPWGLLIGIIYAIVFSAGWRLFGEYHRMRLVPTAVLLTVDLAWFGRRLITGSAALFTRRRDADDACAVAIGGVLAVLLIVLLKQALLLSLPYGARPQPADWRQHLGVLYPAPIYRPLILMPVWGRWAMMLAASMGRAAPAASSRTVRLTASMGLRAVGAGWVAAALLTFLYIPAPRLYLGHAVLMAVGTLVASYFSAYLLGRRERGQTEDTILATGLAGELSFLLLYLAVASAIYLY